jgi:hypothetical protein
MESLRMFMLSKEEADVINDMRNRKERQRMADEKIRQKNTARNILIEKYENQRVHNIDTLYTKFNDLLKKSSSSAVYPVNPLWISDIDELEKIHFHEVIKEILEMKDYICGLTIDGEDHNSCRRFAMFINRVLKNYFVKISELEFHRNSHPADKDEDWDCRFHPGPIAFY